MASPLEVNKRAAQIAFSALANDPRCTVVEENNYTFDEKSVGAFAPLNMWMLHEDRTEILDRVPVQSCDCIHADGVLYSKSSEYRLARYARRLAVHIPTGTVQYQELTDEQRDGITYEVWRMRYGWRREEVVQ